MINLVDITNSAFEFFGLFIIIYNCIVLYKDKEIKGISILSGIYFFIWSTWNLFYYLSINHLFSLIIGILISIANITWAILAIHSKFKTRILKS
jgi:predicted double-glycine peptidase